MDKGRSACVVAAALGVTVSSVGFAAGTVTRGRAAAPTPPGTTIQVPRQAPTIQAAVDRAAPGTLILIAPGVYRESVLVTRPDLVIRGADRNRTILDGQFRRPLGIDVRANGVALENLTARDFTQNGFFWQHVDGYRGSYLTASRDREYGLYALGSQHGQFDHSYASGSGDSGFYIGACDPCHAVVTNVLAENNAVGFSGTNASGDIAVVSSQWRQNRLGIVPNSFDDEPLAPQDGMMIAGNQVTGAARSATPQSVEFGGLDGTGIALVGVLDDVVTKNRVSGQPHQGIVVVPNPSIPSRLRPSLHNQVRANVVGRSGTADLVLAGTPADQGNCFEDNQFRTSAPKNLEQAVPCSKVGSGNLTSGVIPLSRLFTRRRHAPSSSPGPAAPTQPNMRNAGTAPPQPATAEPSITVDLNRIVMPPSS